MAATGVSLIENNNFRPEEPVAPGVKPYRQHEYVAGVDYQVAKDWAFEARYDRRRLDHVIEDASLADPNVSKSTPSSILAKASTRPSTAMPTYLTGLGAAYGPGLPRSTATSAPRSVLVPSCPNNPKAVRNYDGLEFRLTKSTSKGWAGMFSYTWSRLWGNYTGLTTTDQIDGGVTGRASPDTTRSFDEPFYYFNTRAIEQRASADRPSQCLEGGCLLQ